MLKRVLEAQYMVSLGTTRAICMNTSSRTVQEEGPYHNMSAEISSIRHMLIEFQKQYKHNYSPRMRVIVEICRSKKAEYFVKKHSVVLFRVI
jgi:hypothetical protein